MIEQREYEDDVLADALRLRALIGHRNSGKSRADRISQLKIAEKLGVSTSFVASTLAGKRRLSKPFVAGMHQHFGIHVRDYSPSTYAELLGMAPLFADEFAPNGSLRHLIDSTASNGVSVPSFIGDAWKLLDESISRVATELGETSPASFKAVEMHRKVLSIYLGGDQ